MKLDIGAAKKKSEILKARTAGGMLKLVNGKSKVRILPWSKKTGKAALGADEMVEFFQSRVVHFPGRGAPIPCPGQGCDECARAEQLMQSSDEKEQQLGKRLSARDQTVFLAYRPDDPGMKVLPFAAPSSVAGPLLSLSLDTDEFPDFLDYQKGRYVVIDKNTTANPSEMYKVVPAGSPSPVPKAVLDQIDASKFPDLKWVAPEGEDKPAKQEAAKEEPAEEEEKPVEKKPEPKKAAAPKQETKKAEPKKSEPKKEAKKPEPKEEEPPEEEAAEEKKEEKPETDEGASEKPQCFGRGYEADDSICQGCAVNEDCKKAMEA